MAQSPLSHQQFAALGGGSRRLTDASSGPDYGYYVSRHQDEGHERKIVGNASPANMATHFAMSQSALAGAARPHEVYQGSWQQQDEHKRTSTYLDVSDRLGNRQQAVNRGINNNQKAIYDAHLGASVYLNPHGHDSGLPTPVSTRYLPSQAHYKITSQGYH